MIFDRARLFFSAHLFVSGLRVLLLAACVQVQLSEAAFADWDYWLQKGYAKVPKCDGNSAGSYVKLANQDGRWVYIDGIATCKDAGEDLIYKIEFVRVAINRERLSDITRDPLVFDWIGLAAYKPSEGAQQIEWLYDEVRPLQGSLPKNSLKRISFGNVEFKIPKAKISRATRFTLYLTAQNIPFTFGAL